MSSKPRIFLSYNNKDRITAETISQELTTAGFNLASHQKDIKAGTSFYDEIKYLYETSEIIVFLLSKNLVNNENYLSKEISKFLEEARQRKVIIVPVLIEKCKIPVAFYEYNVIDLTKNFKEGILNLHRLIENVSEINFDKFTWQTFESLVYDLLVEHGFKNIQKDWKYKNKEIDFLAEYETNTPFETTKTENWIVEVKYYKKERFSISTIREIVGHYSMVATGGSQLLLITNSLLTSVAIDYIKQIKETQNISIQVLDGIKLKSLVLKNKNLLSKYFDK